MIAGLVQKACVLEVCAPKPGNVNRLHDFPDASLEDFLLSAVAIGPAFENCERWSVGRIVRQAVLDTRRFVRSNTNLGLILLLAPLAKAGAAKGPGSIRDHLSDVLKSLTVEDARLAYEAIRCARPGGIGKAPEADISEEPSVTLLQAMILARQRDSIAREYATDYAISFETGLPAFNEALSQGGGFSAAIVQTYLKILSVTPDTLIARKKGAQSACEVSRLASEALAQGGVFTAQGRESLEEMDRALRDPEHALNPGTTADLTAAAIFLHLLQSRGR